MSSPLIQEHADRSIGDDDDAPSDLPEPIRFRASDLDPTGDPRVDLDAFVNARWRAANPVPIDRSCWDAFAILTERAQRIEAMIATDCVRIDAPIGSVERIVGDFWQSGTSSQANGGRDLVERELARIDRLDSPSAIAAYIRDRHARGLDVVFRLDVEPDFSAPEHTIAYVTQAGLGLPDRDDYFDSSPHGIARRGAYVAHIATMLDLAGTSNASDLAEDVFAFETELAAASMSRIELARDVAARFNPMDIESADRATPAFSWSLYFRALGIEPPRRFSLAMPKFHAAFDQALRSTPPHIWRAYLRYSTIDDAAPFLDDAFALAHHRFHGEVLRGRKAQAPRWRRIVETIDDYVAEAMGQMFVARTFDEASKQRVLAIAESLRTAFRTRLANLSWMSDATRRTAIAKLDAMRFRIGYPERWRGWSGLVTDPHSLYANVLAARRFARERDVTRIDQPTDHTQWPMPPQRVNAGYDPQRNEIVFPAGILAPPFFDPDADTALNFGGIGAVIAHEMTHAFDDQGSRFGPSGRFENWWTPEDRARFDALTDRMVAHFGAMTTRDGESIDGRLTLGENIADFGGLAVAHDALMRETAHARDPMIDGYTQAQRFFFSWTAIWRQNLTLNEAAFRLRHDRHAPAAIRANAAATNLHGFVQEFERANREATCARTDQHVAIW